MISSYKNFAGASTDEKPENVAEGSTFHAVDTGEEYVRHNGMWVQDLRRINAIKLAVA
jgi:hypothetical protein